MYNIFHYAKHNNTLGILLLIDFSKAFDSISHEYIKNAMKAFNFSDDFINKVATCLHGFKSQTLVNGCLSAAIDLLRGCRQGDPIAAYLFILSVEILLRRLEKSKFISPWTSKKGLEHLLEGYADDLSIFLKFLGY